MWAFGHQAYIGNKERMVGMQKAHKEKVENTQTHTKPTISVFLRILCNLNKHLVLVLGGCLVTADRNFRDPTLS